MKKFAIALVAGASAFGAFAADQYGSDLSRNDYFTYVNDLPQTHEEKQTTKGSTWGSWGKGSKETTKTVVDNPGGNSYIQVNQHVDSMTINFGKFTDICESPIGFYAYSGEFASEAEQLAYVEQYRKDHPEAELGLGKTSITLTDLEAGMKVGFFMESTSQYGSHKDKYVTLVTDFNFRDPNATYERDKQSTVGALIDPDSKDTKVAVYFGDYSTTPWPCNDVVKIETIVMTKTVIGEDNLEHEVTIEFNDDVEVGGGSVVDDVVVEPKDGGEPISGQPLPGALAVLALAGSVFGGRKVLRKKNA